MIFSTMDFRRALCVGGVVLVLIVSLASAGDIVHQDNIAPKRPGCENNFVLVWQTHQTLIHTSL